MFALAMAAALLTAPPVEVSLTPDQPLPFAYVDEPLVLEVAAPEEGRATVQVEIDGEHGDPFTLAVGPLTLSEAGAHWTALPAVALERDRYRARFTVSVGNEVTRFEQTFCRIDRPAAGQPFPISAHVTGPVDDAMLLAVASIPGRAVRLSAGLPDLPAQVERARAHGLQVVVALPLARLEQPESLVERLSEQLGDGVLRWELEPGAASRSAAPVAAALARSKSRAPVALVASDVKSLEELLSTGAGTHASAVVLASGSPTVDALRELRDAAERAGYEGMELVSLHRPVRSNVTQPFAPSSRQVVTNLSLNAETTLDAGQILNGTDFGSGYVFLCGLAHRLRGAAYVGELDMDSGLRAHVLRSRVGWIVALWSDGGAQELELPLHGVSDLELTDGRNNPRPLPALDGERLTLQVDEEPVYLSGKGGTMLVDAARRRASAEARSLLESKDLQKVLPADLTKILSDLGKGNTGIDRRGFLALLALLPELEQQHHEGVLSTRVAIPAAAGLARLVRLLCIVEHERGEPFLEPLEEMLAQCGEFTAKYLIGSNGNANGYSRQNWLLAEVTRLMAEARQLAAEGRSVEADAVAAFAEARARSLEYAR